MKSTVTFFLLLITFGLYAQDSIKGTSLHVQQTFVMQYHPSFHSSVDGGDKSLNATTENNLSSTTTLYFGAKTWKNGEVYFNPEVAAGSGFSGATGLAGFSNGETFRVGSPAPSVYIARLFFRQLIPLSKEQTYRAEDQNILARMVPAERLIITLGKFSLSDIFDQNVTSHDPKASLLNWSMMDAGAWDYPSNTRGYTYALSVKLVKKKYIMRFCTAVNALWSNGQVAEGFMPTPKNYADAHGENLELILPLKKDFSNTLKFMVFANHGRMGSYADATQSLRADTSLANREVVGTPTSLSDSSSHLVSPAMDRIRGKGRNYYGKWGVVINWEMTVAKKDMVFARLSWNDGKNETWMYTEIDESICFGAFLSCGKIKRPDDKFRIAVSINGISKDHADYLKAGGYGFIIGDGLGHYPKGISPECIVEAQYNLHYQMLTISPDYQFILNPAYNSARGPVNVLSLRVHFEI
jgi:high affinity Mn2+ porin